MLFAFDSFPVGADCIRDVSPPELRARSRLENRSHSLSTDFVLWERVVLAMWLHRSCDYTSVRKEALIELVDEKSQSLSCHV